LIAKLYTTFHNPSMIIK